MLNKDNTLFYYIYTVIKASFFVMFKWVCVSLEHMGKAHKQIPAKPS